MSKPIRVGLIGLSSNPNIQLAGAWAKNAHLPYLLKTPDYTITALCNSSVESAAKAIALYGLDASKVRAYGDPDSLAQDDNVDMVVCSVNVAQHYRLVKPALLAGKMAFCEWPLAGTLEQMEELAALAEQKNVRTIVGLQGRNGVFTHAMKKFIGNGPSQLGDVLSTSMVGYSFFWGMAAPQDVAYLIDIKSGGNMLTIRAIHILDTLTATLGEIESQHTLLKNKRPTVALIDNTFNVIDPAYPNTTPDHVFIHGVLAGDIPFDFQVRGGVQFKDTPAFDWRIYCTRGEIRMVGNEMLWTSGDITVQAYDFVTKQVEDVDLGQLLRCEEDLKGDVALQLGLEAPAENVARLYDAFSQGQTHKYLDFKQSLKWARLIQEAYTANGF
ncbi:hypothetical protein AYL99_03881 [Fonsecaea erecta]|uniref:Uncharacterized protein n=1 Tax=Fonsecaea erecta TaxID=1367422 RepID=A0A178ZPC7_9EURO|nr:hypothetical protein AYL99_03881 [Fonsecaea erecta]OAP61678.1 hypothetical protein AYL99_03881 [Fonsecaea erecta]